MANHLVTLPSGRVLGVSAAGDPIARRIVLLCHPTPGAGLFDPDPRVTSTWGVHLVSVDRPGYGATPPPAADDPDTVASRADDLAGYVEHLRGRARSDGGAGAPDPVGVVGWGTGGMVALAFAARYPRYVDRVVTLQTAAPRGDAFDPQTQLRPPFSPVSLGVRNGTRAPARLTGLPVRVERMLIEAAVQGGAGASADRRALRDRRWTRELGRIAAETLLVYADDVLSPSRDDGRWYRRRIPGAKVVRATAGGPLVIASEWRRVLAHVAPREIARSA